MTTWNKNYDSESSFTLAHSENLKMPSHLRVDSISPASVQAGSGAVNVELIGTGFAPGMHARLSLAGMAEIDATNVTVVSESKIVCTFNVSGRQPGKWDLVVIDSDGRKVSKDGLFQIV